jgi:hypothetical protein
VKQIPVAKLQGPVAGLRKPGGLYVCARKRDVVLAQGHTEETGIQSASFVADNTLVE